MASDEDKFVETAIALRNAVRAMFPGEPRIQAEVLLLASVRLRLDEGIGRAEAYADVARLLDELEARGRGPLLSLVP